MLSVSDLDYSLPESLIATVPASPRESARLMVVPRAAVARGSPDQAPGLISHKHVRDLPGLVRPGDVLVFNVTRVLPARLIAVRLDTGGHLEGLYLKAGPGPDEWQVLLRGNNPKPGVKFALLDEFANDRGLILEVRAPGSEPGSWIVGVRWLGDSIERDQLGLTLRALEVAGHVPLPPYILKAREKQQLAIPESHDREAYQTVYASPQHAGSVAAPTAGLHFTPTLLEDLLDRGAERLDVVLHVGTGTFRPVETDLVEDHPIHAEWCAMDRRAIQGVLAARREGRRIIAVGTTTARTLETYAAAYEAAGGDAAPFAVESMPGSINTDLMITPGYRWRWTDAMLTNFHLPRSTLLAMVGSLLGEDRHGTERLKKLYECAVEQKYRFYSFGDAMWIA